VQADGTERPQAAPTTERIAGALRWHAAGQAAGEVAFYAMVLVLAALLEPRAFGIVAVGMVIVRVATLFAQEGSAGSIIAAHDLMRSDVRATLRFNLVLGGVLTLAVVASANWMTEAFADGGDEKVLRALAVIVLLASVSAVPQALLRKHLDFRRFSLVTGGAAIGTSICAVVAALLGAGVWALVVRQVLYQALVAAFAWGAAASLMRALPAGGEDSSRPKLPPGRVPFLLVAAATLMAMTLDNLVVGAITDATQLGLYSLAFTLAYAPVTQLSWRLGQVLFPAAAATPELAAVARRTARIVRVTSLLMLPVVPVGVALAPSVLPGLFGSEWTGMVAPFQIMLVVAMLHAVLNTVGESLSGTGNITFRAWTDVLWGVGTLVLVATFAALGGIREAALAHLIAFIPLACAYLGWGARRIGSDAVAFWRATRAVVGPVLAQAAVTLAVVEALGDSLGGGAAASAAGLIVLALLLWRAPSRPLADARAAIAMLLPRRTPATA
jgi:PST family polysaccharide transporter